MTLFGTDLGAQAFQVCNFGGRPGTGLFCNTLEINTLQFQGVPGHPLEKQTWNGRFL